MSKTFKKKERFKPKNPRAYVEGRKRFDHALRTMGEDGVLRRQAEIERDERESSERGALHTAGEAVKETINRFTPKFSFAGLVSDERWNSIFKRA